MALVAISGCTYRDNADIQRIEQLEALIIQKNKENNQLKSNVVSFEKKTKELESSLNREAIVERVKSAAEIDRKDRIADVAMFCNLILPICFNYDTSHGEQLSEGNYGSAETMSKIEKIGWILIKFIFLSFIAGAIIAGFLFYNKLLYATSFVYTRKNHYAIRKEKEELAITEKRLAIREQVCSKSENDMQDNLSKLNEVKMEVANTIEYRNNYLYEFRKEMKVEQRRKAIALSILLIEIADKKKLLSTLSEKEREKLDALNKLTSTLEVMSQVKSKRRSSKNKEIELSLDEPDDPFFS